MAMDTVMEDKELGRIVVRVNARARRLVFRAKADALYVSVPPGTAAEELRRAVDKLRDKLRKARRKAVLPPVDLNFSIDADCFKLSLVEGETERFLATSRPGFVRIVCPSGTDFTDGRVQEWLRKVVGEALRRNAKLILPARLKRLSERCGLPYRSVKINSSRGRWGSCSARKDINLSFYLLLLPSRLIDYVLLHELCHTREMNHGERFWELLNRLTDKRASALRLELKNFRLDF